MLENRVKIVATIGPASSSKEMLKKLIKAGADVMRLNMSHGLQSEHKKVIKNIRALSLEENRPIAIFADLQGPKIRVGKLLDKKPIVLKKGTIVTITTRNIIGKDDLISTTYKNLHKDVVKGNRILLDDGLMELIVESVKDRDIKCSVITGGLLKEHKGINLPGVNTSVSSVTQKDLEDLRFAVTEKVDYIALSFVRTAKDITNIKSKIKKLNSNIPIIAKIEKPEAVENIDEILKVTDVIMVARGDLGVEISPQNVPRIQKELIRKANAARIPVITATQMLESMTNSPVPTRAEASDVANAVMDGTDAVMLSGETAAGKYPVKAVLMMDSIITEGEKSMLGERLFIRTDEKEKPLSFTETIVRSAFMAAENTGSKAILAFTESGNTALRISKQRPSAQILALTSQDSTYNKMALLWGVIPLKCEQYSNTDIMIEEGKKIVKKSISLPKNYPVVIVAGIAGQKNGINIIKLEKI